MNLSRHSPAPTRYAGIGLVVALHLAGIYALSAGLIKPASTPKEATILLPPIPDKPLEPEILREPAFKPDKPTFSPVQVPDIPVPPWQQEQTPTVTTTIQRDDAPAAVGGTPTAGTPTQTPSLPAESSGVRTAGAVCSVMPRPEVPVVNWSGEVVLQVIATVRGGRVVGSDFRVAQGAMDSKTRRSLQRSVESALSGYQCQGDAMFQQDFAFRID